MLNNNKGWAEIAAIAVVIGLIALGIMGLTLMWGGFVVWYKGKIGEANLRQASFERKVIVEQALAEKEAAMLRAEATKIVGEMARKFPEYRFQEFLGNLGEAILQGNVEKIIYLPTEAGIPILEAPRFNERQGN